MVFLRLLLGLFRLIGHALAEMGWFFRRHGILLALGKIPRGQPRQYRTASTFSTRTSITVSFYTV